MKLTQGVNQQEHNTEDPHDAFSASDLRGKSEKYIWGSSIPSTCSGSKYSFASFLSFSPDFFSRCVSVDYFRLFATSSCAFRGLVRYGQRGAQRERSHRGTAVFMELCTSPRLQRPYSNSVRQDTHRLCEACTGVGEMLVRDTWMDY